MSPYTVPSSMRKREEEARARRFKWIAGLDEAGRGPLAGPVVAAAVILPPLRHFHLPIIDSKKLSSARREAAFSCLNSLEGVLIGVGIVGETEIDRINILEATREAMRLALGNLPVDASYLLIDGLFLPGVSIPQEKLIRGEGKSVSIAAASIIAKVTRDRIMVTLDRLYPRYGFARHKGYGTPEHLEMLSKYGPCPLHRFSFQPVKDRVKH